MTFRVDVEERRVKRRDRSPRQCTAAISSTVLILVSPCSLAQAAGRISIHGDALIMQWAAQGRASVSETATTDEDPHHL